MRNRILLADLAIAAVVAIVVLVITPGLAVAGVIGLVVLLGLAISGLIARRRSSRRAYAARSWRERP